MLDFQRQLGVVSRGDEVGVVESLAAGGGRDVA
jgi:hypothetical protein